MTKQIQKKEKKFNAFSISVITLLFLAIIGTGVYAYYQTVVSGNVTGTALAWVFKANNQSTTFTVDLGNLKPGASGTIPISLDSTGAGVDIEYDVKIAYASGSPTITNLQFCTTTCTGANSTAMGTTIFEGDLTSASRTAAKTIHWGWQYGNAASAAADTADEGKSVSLVITVTGKQKGA